jgi:Rieske 2Fe-2S family protein
MASFYRASETLVSGSHTLPGFFYTSTEIYTAELDGIFYSHWLCAGREAEIANPGDYSLKQVGDESLILLRDQSGQLRVFANVCRHRGTRMLVEEKGRLSACIQCPYHAWTYNLKGELIGAPLMEEQVSDFEKCDYPLHAIPFALWGGFVFINIGTDAAPFDKVFAPLLDKFAAWNLSELAIAGRIDYDIQANWKLVVQNYSECYHCPLVHPDLARKSPYLSGHNDLYEGPVLGGFMNLNHQVGSLTISGQACAAPLPGVSGDDLQRVYYYAIFPNLLLSLHPDYVMAHTLWPIAPDRTKITCEWLFAQQAFDQPGFNPQDAIQFWDMTNRQDWEMCVRSQQGVRSRFYRQAPYSGQESLLAAFDRQLLKALGDNPEIYLGGDLAGRKGEGVGGHG